MVLNCKAGERAINNRLSRRQFLRAFGIGTGMIITSALITGCSSLYQEQEKSMRYVLSPQSNSLDLRTVRRAIVEYARELKRGANLATLRQKGDIAYSAALRFADYLDESGWTAKEKENKSFDDDFDEDTVKLIVKVIQEMQQEQIINDKQAKAILKRLKSEKPKCDTCEVIQLGMADYTRRLAQRIIRTTTTNSSTGGNGNLAPLGVSDLCLALAAAGCLTAIIVVVIICTYDPAIGLKCVQQIRRIFRAVGGLCALLVGAFCGADHFTA